MAPIELSIPTASTATNAAKPYTAYSISVRQPLRSYTVQKRYSDFVALHEALTSQAAAPPPVPLPPKTWLKSTVSHPELAEERREQFEKYVKAVNGASDARWRNTIAWKTFLNLPANTSSKGAASSSAGRITGASATITDPSVWLDIHRDLKSQLRDARQALARREMATSAQPQHEAGAEVKSCLIRANAMMSALEGGLKSMSGGEQIGKNNSPPDAPTPRLGEGELRRRKDLLASARKEKDNIEYSLSIQVARSQRMSAPDSVDASTNDRNSLMTQPKGPGRSGRVLGAAKETDETRQLDNQGIMQLQQTKMQEQDQDVSVLTGTVQRMREMGVQINNELELQNEMLNMLDKDVDRVDDKINVAKKRIGKIS